MSHSFCQIYVHAVWTVKNREPLLRKEVRVELYSHITKRFKEEGIYLIILGGVEDHMHCLFQLPRNRTVAEIMKLIKADSSRWLNTKDVIEGAFNWQNGYSAFSVSPQRANYVKQYILNQEQHHRKVSYSDEMKMFDSQNI